MAALNAPRKTIERTPRTRRLPVAAAVQIFQGAIVALSGSNVVPASTSTTIRVLGIAEGGADNRLGAAGALTIDFDRGCFHVDNDAADAITAADIGNPCYATDDHTVCKTSASGTKVQAGIVFDVDATGVWVNF